MKTMIALLATGSLLVAPGAAPAKNPSKPKVYKGTFEYVGADGDYVTGKFGKVQLVDGKRNDKLTVHVRRLAKGTTYVYKLQSAASACAADAPGGTDVSGWTYKRLKTSKSRSANATARSKSFSVDSTQRYFVGVFRVEADGTAGELVLCAQLSTPYKRAKPSKPVKPGSTSPASPADTPRGRSEDAPHGKSEDAPHGNANGHGDDKPRGKGEEAPRGSANGHDKDKPKQPGRPGR